MTLKELELLLPKEEIHYISDSEQFFADNELDIKKFKNGLYTQDEINEIIKKLKIIILEPGHSINVKTGFVHSIEAVEDITIFEASTLELDDVFRLNDKYGRSHGHIESEHKN